MAHPWWIQHTRLLRLLRLDCGAEELWHARMCVMLARSLLQAGKLLPRLCPPYDELQFSPVQ